MQTLTATKEWSCSCGFAGAKLYKKAGDMDYSFFLNQVNESISFFILTGHNLDVCQKVGA